MLEEYRDVWNLKRIGCIYRYYERFLIQSVYPRLRGRYQKNTVFIKIVSYVNFEKQPIISQLRDFWLLIILTRLVGRYQKKWYHISHLHTRSCLNKHIGICFCSTFWHSVGRYMIDWADIVHICIWTNTDTNIGISKVCIKLDDPFLFSMVNYFLWNFRHFVG